MILAIDPGVDNGLMWINDPERILVENRKHEIQRLGKPKDPNQTGKKLLDGKSANGCCQLVGMNEYRTIVKILNVVRRLDSIWMLEVLILEGFILGGTQSRDHSVLAPVRVAAAVDYAVRTELPHVTIEYQFSRDKGRIRDETLEAYGLLIKPKTPWRHANDAARHLVHYALKEYV